MLAGPYGGTALQAIGYKELAPWFAGTCSREEAIEGLKRGTRRYAKRQLSWFRRMEEAQFLYIDDYPDTQALCQAALALWREHNRKESGA